MHQRQTVHLVLLSTGSLACGIAGQWAIFTALGPGAETDAFFAALVLPQVLLAIAAAPLLNVLVPLLSVAEDAERCGFAWLLLAALGAGGVALALLLALFAPLWVPLTIPGFSGAQLALTILLARIQMLVFVLAVMALILSAAAQSAGRFVRVERATLVGSLVGLAMIIVMVPSFGIIAAAWAAVLRVTVQGAILLPLLGLPQRTHAAGELGGRVWTRMRPLLVSGALAKTDPLIDRALLSMAPGGALSLFQLAQGLLAAAIEIVSRSWIVPAMPALARTALADPAACRRHLRLLLVRTAVAFSVAFAFLVAVGHDLLRLVLEFGRFSSTDVAQLWWLLLGLSGVAFGACIGQIAAAGFYARGDTATPARLSIVSFAFFAPLKVGAFFAFGLPGVIGACSAYYVTNALAQLFLLQRRMKEEG